MVTLLITAKLRSQVIISMGHWAVYIPLLAAQIFHVLGSRASEGYFPTFRSMLQFSVHNINVTVAQSQCRVVDSDDQSRRWRQRPAIIRFMNFLLVRQHNKHDPEMKKTLKPHVVNNDHNIKRRKNKISQINNIIITIQSTQNLEYDTQSRTLRRPI